MKGVLISLFCGILFSIGLIVSGMINPEKVRGFLDIFGSWDFSLAFVMIGAIGLNFLTFKLVTKSKPICSEKYYLPSSSAIDGKLLSGAVIFGLGWGILGICPGPGLVNLGTLDSSALLFVISMTAGMGIYKFVERKIM